MEDTSIYPFNADMLYYKIGPRGRWQMRAFIVYILYGFTASFKYMPLGFIYDTPSHHCKIPGNSTKNMTIPLIKENGDWVDDQCSMFVASEFINETKPCSDGWEFDPYSGYVSTVVTDFELVCGKSILVEVTMMVFIIVQAVSLVPMTKLADAYGRKPVLLASVLAKGIIGSVIALSPDLISFIIFGCLLEVAQSGFYATIYIMILELFPTKDRALAENIREYFYLIGLMVLSLLVYLCRSWRVLQVVMYAPTIVLAGFCCWFAEESIPWLIAKGHYSKVEEVIRRAAKINGTLIPDDLFQSTGTVVLDEYSDKENENNGNHSKLGSTREESTCLPCHVVAKPTENNSKKNDSGSELEPSLLQVFRSSRMVQIFVISQMLWFINCLVYNSLALTSVDLSGDRYLNFFLQNLAELPAMISFHWSVNRYGRRWPLCIYHIMCGIPLILTVVNLFVTRATWLGVALNFIGRFGITGSYCIIILYLPEMCPTNLRSMLTGIVWMGGYLGEIIAPYCRPLALYVPGVYRGVSGGLSIIVGLLVLTLPETSNHPLPSTIAEVEGWPQLGSKPKRHTTRKKPGSEVDLPLDTI